MTETRSPLLTVAVPLFHAASWFDNLLLCIQRIPDNTRIVLSDEVSSDDTATRLAQALNNDPRIEVRLRHGSSGWREHCNALIAECTTPFFALLPQDDLIEPGYYEKLLATLEHSPECGIAFGTIIAEGGDFTEPTRLPGPPITLAQHPPWHDAIELYKRWNTGIPFRAVIRHTVLIPIPQTPGDQFADKIWVFGMALNTYLIEVADAIYYKRYHSGNTHSVWNNPNQHEMAAQLTDQIRLSLSAYDEYTAALEQIDALSGLPSISVFLMSWKPPHHEAEEIARQLKPMIEHVSKIYTTGPHQPAAAGNPDTQQRPPKRLRNKMLKVALDECNSELMLVINTDCQCADWPALVRRCISIFRDHQDIAAWAPQVHATTATNRLSDLSPTDNNHLMVSAYLDTSLFCLSPHSQKRLHDVDHTFLNNYGWDINRLITAHAFSTGKQVVIDTSIQVRHPVQQPDTTDKRQEVAALLTQLTPVEKSQHILLNHHIEQFGPMIAPKRVT